MRTEQLGVVYTQSWVVNFILDIVGFVPGSGITKKIIIEPSCGKGVFLTSIAERLADEVLALSCEWDQISHAVRAYDIDSKSLKDAKNNVMQTLVQKGCPTKIAEKLTNQWIVQGDFILEVVPASDFIVGNPPYVRATEINLEKRAEYVKRLHSVTNGCDLYVSFYDRAIDTLKKGGVLCFICADRWLQNQYGRRLRKRINDECNLTNLIRMHDVDVFDKKVSTYPAITTIRKDASTKQLRFVNCFPNFNKEDASAVVRWLNNEPRKFIQKNFEAAIINKPTGADIYPLGSHELVDFISKAQMQLPNLEEAGVNVGIGIATGCDEIFLTEIEDIVERDRMLPIFYFRDYRKGLLSRRRWLINPWQNDGQLVDLERYPKLRSYFESHKERLKQRHVAQKNKVAWYRTIDKIFPELMKRNLLLLPDIASTPQPLLSFGLYPHHNCYWLASDEWDLSTLGGLIMADTTKRFIEALGVKMRGGTLRFQAQYLRLVHLPKYDNISEEIKIGLSKAFQAKDVTSANYYAEAAYKEALN